MIVNMQSCIANNYKNQYGDFSWVLRVGGVHTAITVKLSEEIDTQICLLPNRKILQFPLPVTSQ